MFKKSSSLLAALAVLAAVPIAGRTRIETGEGGMPLFVSTQSDATEMQL